MGVRLERKTRASFRMELQGQEDAGARVVSEACIASVDSVVKWPELLEWLEWPDEFSICVARGLLSAWPGVFYWREDQGATEVAKMARLEGLEDMKTEKLE